MMTDPQCSFRALISQCVPPATSPASLPPSAARSSAPWAPQPPVPSPPALSPALEHLALHRADPRGGSASAASPSNLLQRPLHLSEGPSPLSVCMFFSLHSACQGLPLHHVRGWRPPDPSVFPMAQCSSRGARGGFVKDV